MAAASFDYFMLRAQITRSSVADIRLSLLLLRSETHLRLYDGDGLSDAKCEIKPEPSNLRRVTWEDSKGGKQECNCVSFHSAYLC